MLGCLSLEFFCLWSCVPKPRLCGPFPGPQSGKVDRTLHQVGIPYLLAERGNKRLSGSAVALQMGDVAAPIPGLCPFQFHAGRVSLEAVVALHHT